MRKGFSQLCTHNNDKCDPQRFPTPKTGDAGAAYSPLILDLPAELLSKVVGYLDKYVINLVATCKKLKKSLEDSKACQVWDWLETGNPEAQCVPIYDLRPWARTSLSNIAFARFVTCDVTRRGLHQRDRLLQKKNRLFQKSRLFAYLEGSKHVPWDALAFKRMSRQQLHLSDETVKRITEYLIRNGANEKRLEQWIRTRTRPKQINHQRFVERLRRARRTKAKASRA
jgi:hypothetical protein